MDYANPNLYRILAYFNGPKARPDTFASTGCFLNAEKTAKDIAAEGYLAIVHNTESGERYEHKPTAAPVTN